MRPKEQPGDFDARQQDIFTGEDPNKGLSSRQVVFCYEYVANKGNGVAAAMASGCKSETSAGVRAHKWLKRAKIKKKIAEISQCHFKGLKIRAEDIINELATLGFSNVRDIITWDANGLTHVKSSDEIGENTRAIREIEVTEDRLPSKKNGENVIRKEIKFKMHGKRDALETLLKVQHPDLFKDKEKDGEGKPIVNINVGIDGKDIQNKNASELARSYFELLKALSGSSGNKI